ncbi:hypothetical protein EBU94_08035, partial [bacterium]|nr:hypothetical protein [bacterium]
APTPASVERILAIYERLNLTAFSTQVSAIPLENGIFDKEVKTGSWKHLTQSRINYNQTYNGVAIRTGKDFNCTVIDIDDLTAPHNIDLMDLMSDCNMVAETFKGGKHYMFKYDPRLKQTTGNKLDIRNDGGIIYAEPSHAVYNGKVVGKYKWVLVPDDDETLLPVPETVIQFLRAFDAEKYIVGENKPKEKKVVNTVVSEEEEDNSEDTQNTDEQTKTKKIIEVLLEKIAKTRWDNYNDWIKIGIICYNEKLPLELWDRLKIIMYGDRLRRTYHHY